MKIIFWQRTILISFIGLYSVYSNTGFSAASFRNDVVATITSPNSGPWGTWGAAKYCNSGQYARGFALRVEAGVGSGDDTSLNDVALYCTSSGGGVILDNFAAPGATTWGAWGRAVYCGSSQHLNGFSLRVEQPISGDDTAANDLVATCTNGALLKAGNGGPFGTWGAYKYCPANSAICGISVKSEPYQGANEDDTALNGVKFFCSRK